MTMSIVHYLEFDTTYSYCDRCLRTLADGDEQHRCEPEPEPPAEPAPSPWVDYHCVRRWHERVDRDAERVDIIAAVGRIVTAGRRVSWSLKPGCVAYAHPDYPGTVIVVRLSSNAAITCLTAVGMDA
jgi:hypothetical protein